MGSKHTNRRRPWTAADNELLIRLYPDRLTREVAQQLGRAPSTVYAQASKLGVTKSAAFLASSQSGRLDGVRGSATRFKAGQRSWNKGQRFVAGGRSPETQFRPGHRPHTWVPIGTLRIADGILQRKVTDTRYTPRDFVAVHRLVWEAAHGPVPAGHVVVFKPGRKTTVLEDITLDALELVTRRELMARNTVHRLPKEVAQVVRLRGQLVRRINRMERQREKQD